MVRLKVKKVIIVGGNGAISSKIQDEIKAMGIDVQRISGVDRYETSIEIAKEIGIRDGIVITNGNSFADAISIAPIAAQMEMPIILSPKDRLTTGELKFIDSSSYKYSYLIGGVSILGETVEASLRECKRIYGKDRYETNFAILDRFKGELKFNNIYIASGENYPDALSVSALASLNHSPVILVKKSGVNKNMRNFIKSNYSNTDNILVMGGPTIISENTIDIELWDKFFRNASKPINTPTYDGSNQAVHPKVVYFNKGWNGYKYWMGITPYPYGNDDFENPQILVSNDGLNFDFVKGLNKPLFMPEDLAKGGHYSDIHLCFVDNKLEVYFRYNPANAQGKGPNNNENKIYVTRSSDGVNWSDKKLVLDNNTLGLDCDYLSPIVNYEDQKYKIWFSNYDGNLYYTETTDWKNFSKILKCNFRELSKNFKIWHQDLIKTDIGYEIVLNGYFEKNFSTQNLYYSSSEDGINFKPIKKIMDYSKNPKAFDNSTLYRSSILKVEDKYYLYYSAMDRKRQWRIGLSLGE